MKVLCTPRFTFARKDKKVSKNLPYHFSYWFDIWKHGKALSFLRVKFSWNPCNFLPYILWVISKLSFQIILLAPIINSSWKCVQSAFALNSRRNKHTYFALQRFIRIIELLFLFTGNVIAVFMLCLKKKSSWNTATKNATIPLNNH